MTKSRITIFHNQAGQEIGAQIGTILSHNSNYSVELVCSARENSDLILECRSDCVILVLSPSLSKAERVNTGLRIVSANIPLLLVVGSDSADAVLESLFPEAQDFLIVPFQEAEVRARVQRLLSRNGIQHEDRVCKLSVEVVGLTRFVGESPTFLAVKQKIPPIAKFECPVLVTGETGTGKEVCACALHSMSSRAGKPFLPVNCGAIPADLFENEIFGHQKGAFTGACCVQRGLVTEAEGENKSSRKAPFCRITLFMPLVHQHRDERRSDIPVLVLKIKSPRTNLML